MDMSISLSFLAVLRQNGFEPDCKIIADGKLHRFRDWLDKPGRKNCWYVLFPDNPQAGAFGCWRRGIKVIWRGYGQYDPLLIAQRLANIRDLLAEKYAVGREMALKIWESSMTANGNHRYLQMKKVKTYGLHYYRGALLVPVMDAEGRIYGLQRIYHDGSKCFTYGTDKVGHFFLIGVPRNNILCIAEGYATSATIHEITGHAVAIAFDAGNLPSVAEKLQSAYPDHRLFLCADDDKWTTDNPGLMKAWQAKEAVKGEIVVPLFSNVNSLGTDFNDLYLEEGPQAVLKLFPEVNSCSEPA